LTISLYVILFPVEVVYAMDVRLLELLRKKSTDILKEWKKRLPEEAHEARSDSSAMRDLANTLLPLLLDSLQFPGFNELGHLADRIGRTAWSEEIPVKKILDLVFRLRLVIEKSLPSRNRPAGRDSGTRELHSQIDIFAATCAEAYVQACTQGAAAPPAGHADTASALSTAIRNCGNGPAFGALMKRLRKDKGVSMRSLAEELGMARGYVSNIENGKAIPSFKAIVKICELLDPGGEGGLMILGIVQRLPEQVREKLIG
jgi:DNA-binding XRE family transcriptional regulator